MKYKSNTNIVYSCKYHVIWCSKYRRKVLFDGIEDRLKEIVQQFSKEKKAEVIELEIMPDHVHFLIEVDPQYGIHRIVKYLKGISSRLIRQEYSQIRTRLPTLWTNSYFLSTVGGAPLSIIKYIENQKHV